MILASNKNSEQDLSGFDSDPGTLLYGTPPRVEDVPDTLPFTAPPQQDDLENGQNLDISTPRPFDEEEEQTLEITQRSPDSPGMARDREGSVPAVEDDRDRTLPIEPVKPIEPEQSSPAPTIIAPFLEQVETIASGIVWQAPSTVKAEKIQQNNWKDLRVRMRRCITRAADQRAQYTALVESGDTSNENIVEAANRLAAAKVIENEIAIIRPIYRAKWLTSVEHKHKRVSTANLKEKLRDLKAKMGTIKNMIAARAAK